MNAIPRKSRGPNPGNEKRPAAPRQVPHASVSGTGDTKNHRIRLSHSVIVKSPGLLPMLYTVRELAEAVGIPERTLRAWLAAGAPHQREAGGHIWIHGREFSGWVAGKRASRRQYPLGEGQGYCLRCKRVVNLLEPRTIHFRGKLNRTRGTCDRCGGIVCRGVRIPASPDPDPTGETPNEPIGSPDRS